MVQCLSSDNLKFEVKCEFEEFCYVAERCHEIQRNTVDLKRKLRKERSELKIFDST